MRRSMKRPESLQVVTIRLDEKEDAAEVLKKIESADDFRKLAAERQPPGRTRNRRAGTIARSRKDPELGDVERFSRWTRGSGPRSRTSAARTGSWCWWRRKRGVRRLKCRTCSTGFALIMSARKQQELTESLFADLAQRYDVRIMPVAAKSGEERPTQNRAEPGKKDP